LHKQGARGFFMRIRICQINCGQKEFLIIWTGFGDRIKVKRNGYNVCPLGIRLAYKEIILCLAFYSFCTKYIIVL